MRHGSMLNAEAQLPPTLEDRVEVSFLIQYFAGRGRSTKHAQSVAGLLKEVRVCVLHLRTVVQGVTK